MANINVVFFGVLAELANASELMFENINHTDELTEQLITRFPEFKKHALLIALNNTIVKQNTELKNGDTVSVMPPFSGG